jgi:hypothetical protein
MQASVKLLDQTQEILTKACERLHKASTALQHASKTHKTNKVKLGLWTVELVRVTPEGNDVVTLYNNDTHQVFLNLRFNGPKAVFEDYRAPDIDYMYRSVISQLLAEARNPRTKELAN